MSLQPASSAPNDYSQYPRQSIVSRLGDIFSTIWEEYNKILVERHTLHQDCNRLWALFTRQDIEINLIKRAVRKLERCSEIYRQHFEEELSKLAGELEYERSIASLQPPLPPQKLSTNLPSSSASAPTSLAPSVIQLSEDRGHHEPTTNIDRKSKRRVGAGDGLCNSKRIQSEDRGSCSSRDSSLHRSSRREILPESSLKVDFVDTSYGHGSSTIQSLPPPSPSSSGNNEEPSLAPSWCQDLAESSVPPGCRKEYSDWAASFNPKFLQNLDVDLIRSTSQPSIVCSIHFSPDGYWLAAGCHKAIYIYSIQTGVQVCSLTDPVFSHTEGDIYIRSVRFSPDGEYLAAGAEDMNVRIWNIKQRKLCDIFSGHSGEICALDYSPNGHSIVSGSMDGSAIVWDLHTFNHKCLRISDPAAKIKKSSNAAGITSVSVSSCGHYVAGGCLDNIIRIWSMKTGELKAKLGGHEDSIYAVRFMNDAKRLVSGGLDCSVRFWDVSSLQDAVPDDGMREMAACPIIKIFRGHSDYVLTVACDNRYIVSGAKDCSIFLWDTVEDLACFKLNGHANSVVSVDLHGSTMATAGGDMRCRVWALSTPSFPQK